MTVVAAVQRMRAAMPRSTQIARPAATASTGCSLDARNPSDAPAATPGATAARTTTSTRGHRPRIDRTTYRRRSSATSGASTTGTVTPAGAYRATARSRRARVSRDRGHPTRPGRLRSRTPTYGTGSGMSPRWYG